MFRDFGDCGHGQHGDFWSKRRGGWGWDFDPTTGSGWAGWGWFGGHGGPRRGGPGRRGGRMFGQGDLKYVILQLLEEKPRHGYEIIKELEDRFAGAYAPSPGTVYPTLTMLEDLGYARATPEEGGRRIYDITPEGKKHLEENKGTVDDIFERIAQFGASFFSAPMMDVTLAFKRLAWSYGAAARHMHQPDRLKKIQEILERAAKEIEEVGSKE